MADVGRELKGAADNLSALDGQPRLAAVPQKRLARIFLAAVAYVDSESPPRERSVDLISRDALAPGSWMPKNRVLIRRGGAADDVDRCLAK